MEIEANMQSQKQAGVGKNTRTKEKMAKMNKNKGMIWTSE